MAVPDNAPDNFFEDFQLGRRFVHAPHPPLIPELVIESNRLTGAVGLDEILAFNLVFSQSVADISRNAVANLGYAEGVFGARVRMHDTLTTASEVIGLRETSSRDAGVVYVRTESHNQKGEEVLRFARWVLVKKRDAGAPAPAPVVPVFSYPEPWPDIPSILLGLTGPIDEEAHQQATRLWGNPARLHFDPAASKYGRRMVYGGYVLALAFSVLRERFPQLHPVTLHGGAHLAPVFAGDVLSISALFAPHRLRLLASTTEPVLDFDFGLR